MSDQYGPATAEVSRLLNFAGSLNREQSDLIGAKRKIGSVRRWQLMRRLRQVAAGTEYEIRWKRVNRVIRYEVTGSISARRAIRDAAIVTMMPSVLSNQSESFLREPVEAVMGRLSWLVDA